MRMTLTPLPARVSMPFLEVLVLMAIEYPCADGRAAVNGRLGAMRDVLKNVAVWVAAAAATVLNWLGWLGWDTRRDVQPDGSTTGPYEAWQVAGLVVVLAAVVVATAVRRPWAAVLAATLAMGAAVVVSWSGDDSGLWVIGAGMVVAGMLATTIPASILVHRLARARSAR
jgi:hypothetical protein